MSGLDERMHDLVAAAGREVSVPSPEGVRRRGTRRRLVRSGVGGLAVVALAVGSLLGVRAVQGSDRAGLVQPSTSDLPSGVMINIVPSDDDGQDVKLVEADGRLSMAAFEDEGVNDLWSFPQPDPARKVYQIQTVSPGSEPACLSTVPNDQPLGTLLPCDPQDATQLWAIESEWDTVTFRGLGPLVGETDPDLLTILVQPDRGPEPTPSEDAS